MEFNGSAEALRGAALWVFFGALWFSVGRQDASRRQIDNRLLGAGLVGLLVLGGPQYGGVALSGLLLHMVLCLGAALGLWYVGVWPAGDAKLFVLLGGLLVLLLPMTAWSPMERVLVHLVNVFVPGAVLVLAELLWRLCRDNALRRRIIGVYVLTWWPSHARRTTEDVLSNAARVLVLNLLMVWALAIFGRRALIPIVLASWTAAYPLNRLLSSGPRRGLTSLAAVLLVAAGTAYQARGFDPLRFGADAARMLAFSWTLQCVFVLVKESLDTLETEQVPLADLRPGHRLNERFAASLAGADELGKLYADGLLAAQLEPVRARCRARGLTHAAVSRTYPFANWMFMGTLLTAVAQRDAVSLVRSWLP